MLDLSSLNGATVFITGGQGFIGAAVCGVLERAGAQVRVFEGDLLTDDLGPSMGGATHVVHLAARSGGVGFQTAGDDLDVLAENLTMTRAVLAAARTSGIKRVFLASSGVVYARDAGEVLTESSPVVAPSHEAVSGYAWSKLTDEALAQWVSAQPDGPGVVAGRFTNVYGPAGPFDSPRETVIHALVRKCVAAEPSGEVEVWGDGSAERNFVFVEDAAEGVCAALVHGEPGAVYNIAATDGVTIGELARTVVQALTPGVTLRFDPSKPTGPAKRVLDATRLRGLGWEPGVDLGTGLARTGAWWRAQAAE